MTKMIVSAVLLLVLSGCDLLGPDEEAPDCVPDKVGTEWICLPDGE